MMSRVYFLMTYENTGGAGFLHGGFAPRPRSFYLVSSFLWQRTPLWELSSWVQAIIIDFFWDRLHWLPQVALFLPKEEGDRGWPHNLMWRLALADAVVDLLEILVWGYFPFCLLWGLFSIWKLLWKQRVQHQSSFWLLREQVGHGDLPCASSWAGATVAEALCPLPLWEPYWRWVDLNCRRWRI